MNTTSMADMDGMGTSASPAGRRGMLSRSTTLKQIRQQQVRSVVPAEIVQRQGSSLTLQGPHSPDGPSRQDSSARTSSTQDSERGTPKNMDCSDQGDQPRMQMQNFQLRLPTDERNVCLTPNPPADCSPNSQPKDNADGELVIFVGDLIRSQVGHHYTVQKSLGRGACGHVVEATNQQNHVVAIKVAKSNGLSEMQARMEYSYARALYSHCPCIVHVVDAFVVHGHVCTVFEKLHCNIYELLEWNDFKGLSLTLIRVAAAQLLAAVHTCHSVNIVHCDIKPENIMLVKEGSARIRLIDFSSALQFGDQHNGYLQSRYYRAPEILLRHAPTCAVDIWSLGCTLAEMFIGLPLVAGGDEHDQLHRIQQCIGPIPETMVVESSNHLDHFMRDATTKQLRWKTDEEYFKSKDKRQVPRRKYFKYTALHDLIQKYPAKKGLSPDESASEALSRASFLHLIQGMLQISPDSRWSASQCLQHPFITGSHFSPDFEPTKSSLNAPTSTQLSTRSSRISMAPFPAPTSPTGDQGGAERLAARAPSGKSMRHLRRWKSDISEGFSKMGLPGNQENLK